MIKLILTSDDFGLRKVYNEKIIEMLQLGYLTSVSVMVKRISEEQISQVHTLKDIDKNQDISIGLHLELSESNYLNEIEEQWSLFEVIFGFCPDYLDLHKNHSFKGDYNALAKFCNLKDIAFRKYPQTSRYVKQPTCTITATYLEIEEIKNRIDNLVDNNICEIVFHIGSFDINSKSILNRERELDIEKLKQICSYLKLKNIGWINYKSI
ncbi:MAG: ChbG/HpnK family deacetylase [Bacteroidales bacterium]|jgi:predicted glycoside hydrolase/deacetylase ChbG (UPF0249 family)|nr:ChbG/HpnK family deacetylase [Bacteroidales bacterium]